MGYKIVRDRQPDWCEAHGVSGSWRISPDPVSALTAKIGEEYGEFTARRDPGELYDLLDVVQRLIELADPDLSAHRAHQDKVERLGGFAGLTEWHPDPAEGWK